MNQDRKNKIVQLDFSRLKSKKGFVLFLLAFGVVMGFFLAWYTALKSSKLGNTIYLGEEQIEAIKTFQNAQALALYTDQAARMAAQQTIAMLAENGGYYEAECGNYGTYALWSDIRGSRDCYPEQIRYDIARSMENKLRPFLSIDNMNTGKQMNQTIKQDFHFSVIGDQSLDIIGFSTDRSTLYFQKKGTGVPARDKLISEGRTFLQPNIHTTIRHNLSEYHTLQQLASQIVSRCSGAKDKQACTEQTVKQSEHNTESLELRQGTCEKNFGYSADTKYNIEQTIVNNLIRDIQKCAFIESKDSCICNIELISDEEQTMILKANTANREFSDTMTFHIENDPDGKKAIIEYQDTFEHRYTINTNLFISNAQELTLPEQFWLSVQVNFEDDHVQIEKMSVTADSTQNGQAIELNIKSNKMKLNRVGEELILGLSRNTESSNICEPDQQILQLCAKSDQLISAYNPATKKTTKNNIYYRFALAMQDNPPPILDQIVGMDAKKAENSLLIVWNESTDEDIKDYIVYTSQMYDKTYLEEHIETSEFLWFDYNFKKQVLNTADAKTIQLTDEQALRNGPECVFDPIRQVCNFVYKDNMGIDNIKIEPNQLYYAEPFKQYIYITDAPDELDTTFTVIARDMKNQMITDVNEYNIQKAKSIDDLAPGMVKISENMIDTYTLSWEPPQFNIDGSTPATLARYEIYISDKPFENIKDARKYDSTADEKYYFAALEEKNNYVAIVTSDDAIPPNIFETVFPIQISIGK